MKKLALAFIIILMISGNLYSQLPISLSAKAGTNMTFGSFNDAYKNGLSWDLSVYYSTPLPGLDLSASLGHDGFKYQSTYLADQVSANFTGVTLTGFSPDWTASDMNILFGAKFTLPVGTTKTYLTAEGGVHFVNFADRLKGQRINGSSNTQMTIDLTNNTESVSQSAFGYAIGGGMEIPIVPKVALDISLKYNYTGVKFSNAYTIFRNNNEQFTVSELKNMNYLTVRGGIIIHL
jgi:opacity protein-like surface antigen